MFVRSPSEQVRRLYYRFGSRALHPEIYRLHGCSHFRAFSVFVKASRVIELQVIAIHAPDVNRSSVRHVEENQDVTHPTACVSRNSSGRRAIDERIEKAYRQPFHLVVVFNNKDPSPNAHVGSPYVRNVRDGERGVARVAALTQGCGGPCCLSANDKLR